MNRRISIIGSIVASVLIGGTVVYGSQNNNAVASPNNSPLIETLIPGAVSANTLIATPSIVATGIVSNVTSSSATFHGAIYPRDAESTYWFEYSADPLLGLILIRKTSRISLITDSKQRFVEATATGLMKSTKYYFRIVTEGSSGTVRGERVSFNTP